MTNIIAGEELFFYERAKNFLIHFIDDYFLLVARMSIMVYSRRGIYLNDPVLSNGALNIAFNHQINSAVSQSHISGNCDAELRKRGMNMIRRINRIAA